MGVDVLGLDDLHARLKAITESMTTAEASRVYLNAARGIRNRVKATVPKGDRRMYFSQIGSGGKRKYSEAGQMKKSVVAMIPKRRQRKQLGGPAAIAVIVQKKRRIIGAPHVHFLTLGTDQRTPKSNRVMVFPNYRLKGNKGSRSSRFVFSRAVAGMKRRPEIAAAFVTSSGEVLERALTASKRIIDKAMERKR